MEIIEHENPNFTTLWLELWKNDPYQNPTQSLDIMSYYQAYAIDLEFKNISFIVAHNKQAIIGSILTVQISPDGKCSLSAYANPIVFIESSTASYQHISTAFKLAKAKLEEITSEYNISQITYRNPYPWLSNIAKHLLDNGAKAKPYFTQILDLTIPEKDLYRQIRRSYRSLVNYGLKNLDLRLLDSSTITMDAMEEFRLLHLLAAGRQTRSIKTWKLQYDLILHRQAFVIFGFLDGEFVTAGYFSISANYCEYGVSASNRSLFDKPLSHGVIWKAILHAKNLGCRYFELGEQLYTNQSKPSPKESGISKFKSGFGGNTYMQLDILWQQDS